MLGTMMSPATVTLIPQYLLWFQLGLISTYVPLTALSWLGGSAFMVFFLRQFIMSIPLDLDEAALIDGANPLRILWNIIMPLIKPALTPCKNRHCPKYSGLEKAKWLAKQSPAGRD